MLFYQLILPEQKNKNMFDFVRQASQQLQDQAIAKTAGVGSYLEKNFDQLEQKLAATKANAQPAGQDFYDIRPNEPSAILRNRKLTVGEKIEELIEKEEEDEDGSPAEHRLLLQSEREFLLAFASQNFNSQTREKEQVDEFATDLISVLNHFFDYGFRPKDAISTYDATAASTLSLSNQGELSLERQIQAKEILSPLRPKSKQITHYWDLITKYLSAEYQSISYVNHHLGGPEEPAETETSLLEEKERKALTWLIIMLNEDQLLYYCFHSIFQMGTFLSYYDESKSFLFKDRAAILDISRRIYDNKLFINSEINQKYQAFLKQSLEERIQTNQKMKQATATVDLAVKDKEVEQIVLQEVKIAPMTKIDSPRVDDFVVQQLSDPMQSHASQGDQFSSTDGNMKSFGHNLGDNIHEPIIKLDSHVPVSLPDTQFGASFAAVVSLEEPYQSQVLFDKYKDGHLELQYLSEEEEQEEPEDQNDSISHNIFSQSKFKTQAQHNQSEDGEEAFIENRRLTESDCIEQTFSFDKFVQYYQQRYKIEIRTKTPRDGKERCGLCQRPNVSLERGQRWILPHRLYAGKFKLAEVSGVTCAQCSEFMRKHPYVELDANQLQGERNKTISQTLIQKRKFHKMCELIFCDKLENLYSQDVIQENLSFKRTFLTNVPIKASEDVDQQNQLLMLITGELLKTLNKAISSLEKHLSANSCVKCKANDNNILQTCQSCKKSNFKIYEIEKYRQCRTCKVKLHSVQKCLLKHKCKNS